jgi:hypothetical protein
MHTFDASTEIFRILYPQIFEPQFGKSALAYDVSSEGIKLRKEFAPFLTILKSKSRRVLG